MLAKSEKAFIELFNTIEDDRDDNRLLYPLSEIIFLVIVGVLCCAESWDEIVKFGRHNIDFLRKYFSFEHGIPSKSLLSKVFGMIEKKKLGVAYRDSFERHPVVQARSRRCDG